MICRAMPSPMPPSLWRALTMTSPQVSAPGAKFMSCDVRGVIYKVLYRHLVDRLYIAPLFQELIFYLHLLSDNDT